MSNKQLTMDNIELLITNDQIKAYGIHIIIQFEDNGQDFFEWGLDERGKIKVSEPFQARVWKNYCIDMGSIEEGQKPIVVHPGPSRNAFVLDHRIERIITIRYPKKSAPKIKEES